MSQSAIKKVSRSAYRSLLLSALLLATSLSLPASAQSVCRPADKASADLIEEMGRYSSAPAGDAAIMRDSLRLPSVPRSQVALVTNESVCKKAKATYQTSLSTPGHTFSGRVYVVKIGTVYAVLDPTFNLGDPTNWIVQIRDSRYRQLSLY